MKTKIYLLAIIALAVSACTTGSWVTTSYVDGIYFNPADIPPPVVVEGVEQQDYSGTTKSGDRVIISRISDDEGVKTMDNYIFDGEDAGEYSDLQLLNLDHMDAYDSDTIIYYDDNEVRYVINNYYDSPDIDFAYRINRFHRPYSRFYDPYYWDSWYWDPWYYNSFHWDSWHYPFSSISWSWGMGYNPWYWSYSSWYSPWYSPWYGGYYYGSWYSPYYSYYGWGYPYNSYWAGTQFNSENYNYGHRRDFNTMAGGRRDGSDSRALNPRAGVNSLSAGSGGVGDDAQRRVRTVTPDGTTIRATRDGIDSQGRTITEMRRNTSAAGDRSREGTTTVTRSTDQGSVRSATSGGTTRETLRQPATTTTRQYTRQAGTAGAAQRESNTYTPSYNQERSTGRSSYNVQSARPATGTSQQGTVKSGSRPVTVYSRPSSSSSGDRTYRSTSTYNRSSSTGSSYSLPSQSRSTGSSAPARSSSTFSNPGRSSAAPSFSSPGSVSSSGGRSGGGSSSGGSSSGGGGGGTSSGGGSGRR